MEGHGLELTVPVSAHQQTGVLDRLSSTPVTVRYSTRNGTAIAPGDYTPTTGGTITIPASTTARTVSVPVRGDQRREPHETFTVHLSTPTGGTLGDPTGTGTIRNDD